MKPNDNKKPTEVKTKTIQPRFTTEQRVKRRYNMNIIELLQ